MHAFGQFPANNSLKVVKLGAQSPSNIVFGVLVMFLISALLAWWAAAESKGILKDYQISKGYHVIDADIGAQSECKTQKFALTSCNVYIRYQGQNYKESFSFFDFSSSDYTVMPIASDNDPNLVTIDLAVKSLTNRAIFIGIFFLIALATFLFGLRTLFVRLPRISKMLSMLNRAENKPWRLVALETNKDANKYTTTLNGKSIEMSFNFTKNKPWLLTDINGNKHLLAIAAKNSDTAIPLDEQLMVLKGLKKKEREQLQQSLNAQVPIL